MRNRRSFEWKIPILRIHLESFQSGVKRGGAELSVSVPWGSGSQTLEVDVMLAGERKRWIDNARVLLWRGALPIEESRRMVDRETATRSSTHLEIQEPAEWKIDASAKCTAP